MIERQWIHVSVKYKMAFSHGMKMIWENDWRDTRTVWHRTEKPTQQWNGIGFEVRRCDDVALGRKWKQTASMVNQSHSDEQNVLVWGQAILWLNHRLGYELSIISQDIGASSLQQHDGLSFIVHILSNHQRSPLNRALDFNFIYNANRHKFKQK